MSDLQFERKIFIIAEYDPKYTETVIHGFSLVDFFVIKSFTSSGKVEYLLQNDNDFKRNVIVLNNPWKENLDVLEFERIFAPKTMNTFIGFFIGSNKGEEYNYYKKLRESKLFLFSYEFFLKDHEYDDNAIMYILNDFLLEFKNAVISGGQYESTME